MSREEDLWAHFRVKKSAKPRKRLWIKVLACVFVCVRMWVCVERHTRDLFKRQPSLYQTNVLLFSMKYLYPPVIAEVIDILPLLCSCLPDRLLAVSSCFYMGLCPFVNMPTSKYYGGKTPSPCPHSKVFNNRYFSLPSRGTLTPINCSSTFLFVERLDKEHSTVISQ